MNTGDAVVGQVGRVTGTISAQTVGEIMVAVRGGSEAFLAFAESPEVRIERGARVVVIEYHPPRTVVVSQL